LEVRDCIYWKVARKM